jgi:hypothetical protein
MIKSKNWIILAPGPGNYRLPSDFGIYDHLNGACGHKGGFTDTMTNLLSKRQSISQDLRDKTNKW